MRRFKNKKILKQFIAFLKSNHVYDEYLVNLENGSDYRQRYSCPSDATLFIIEYVKWYPEDLILDAFDWEDSRAWPILSNKWADEVFAIKQMWR